MRPGQVALAGACRARRIEKGSEPFKYIRFARLASGAQRAALGFRVLAMGSRAAV